MSEKPPHRQRDDVDFITNAMLSVAFLELATRWIADGRAKQISLHHFYVAWNEFVSPEQKMPMSPGIFMGYLYCGLVLAKENWLSLLPDDAGSAKDPRWSLTKARISDSSKTSPSIRHVARRLRNALAHGRVEWEVPAATLNAKTIWDDTILRFRDRGEKTGSFEAEASMRDISSFVKAFHAEIYAHVKSLP